MRWLALIVVLSLLALLSFAPSETHETRAGAGEPPPNDDLAEAIDIASLPFSDGPVRMENATVEVDEPRSSCNFGGIFSTVWYRYASPEDTVLVASASTPGRNTALAVWQKLEPGFREVTCDGFPGASLVGRLAFQAEAGATYVFQVDVVSGAGETVFMLDARTPPPNDNFIDAIEISALPYSDALDTGAATQEQGEPVASCIGGKSAVPPLATVWYAFTPEEDGVIVADTTGSDYDTVINVLVPGDIRPMAIGCGASRVSLPPARVGFEVQAGQLYYFQVGGATFDFGFGSLSFVLSAGVPPANDDFDAAIVVVDVPFESAIDTIAAGIEAEEPAASCAPRGVVSSVWYRISAAEHLLIVVDAAGSGFSPIIGVYEGDDLGGLTQVVCGRPDKSPTIVGFEAGAGETYYLQVAGGSRKGTSSSVAGGGEAATFGHGGNVVLQINSLDIPSCPAPEFSIADRTNDVLLFLTPPEPGRRHDILSTGVSTTDEHVCLRLDFAAAIDPPTAGTDDEVTGVLYLDIDSDGRSGARPRSCGLERDIGVDVGFDLADGTGQLLMVQGGEEGQFAIALFGERSITFVFSQEVIGGDSTFRFVARMSSLVERGDDCAPDRGFIQVPEPAIGDANCDGRVDSRDAVLILQFFAELAPSLPCEYVADANGNGTIGSIDALLVLQLDAGLLDSLPL